MISDRHGIIIYRYRLQAILAAVILLFLGIVGIGILPDLLVRPRLANRSLGVPPSLYLLGFLGGVLTVGIVGMILGPLLIALLLETVDMLVEEQGDDY